MDKTDLKDIPYKRVNTIVVWALFVTLAVVGHRQWFPTWCLYTIYAIFIALPLFWSVHALIHHRKKAALFYLMMDVVAIILMLIFLALKFYLIH